MFCSFQKVNICYSVDSFLYKSYHPCKSPFWKQIKSSEIMLSEVVWQLWIECSMKARLLMMRKIAAAILPQSCNRSKTLRACRGHKWYQQTASFTPQSHNNLLNVSSFFFLFSEIQKVYRKRHTKKFHEKKWTEILQEPKYEHPFRNNPLKMGRRLTFFKDEPCDSTQC